MSTPLRIAVAAEAVLVIAVIGTDLIPREGSGGVGASSTPDPSPLANASPMALAYGSPAAGRHLPHGSLEAPGLDRLSGSAVARLRGRSWAGCPAIHRRCPRRMGRRGQPGDLAGRRGGSPPNGASIGVGRVSWLHSDPSRTDSALPGVTVGPTVNDSVDALTGNERLSVTEPVDVTVAGYAGNYLDLQVPTDISRCPTSYFVWEPGIYAQGPGQWWHLWALDVGGTRVVVHTTDYAGTSAEVRAEAQAMVDSLRIER
jgi:hypothetical protein